MEMETELRPEMGTETELGPEMEMEMELELEPEVGMETELGPELGMETELGPELGMETELEPEMETELDPGNKYYSLHPWHVSVVRVLITPWDPDLVIIYTQYEHQLTCITNYTWRGIPFHFISFTLIDRGHAGVSLMEDRTLI
jgi:hypothetical protein